MFVYGTPIELEGPGMVSFLIFQKPTLRAGLIKKNLFTLSKIYPEKPCLPAERPIGPLWSQSTKLNPCEPIWKHFHPHNNTFTPIDTNLNQINLFYPLRHPLTHLDPSRPNLTLGNQLDPSYSSWNPSNPSRSILNPVNKLGCNQALTVNSSLEVFFALHSTS